MGCQEILQRPGNNIVVPSFILSGAPELGNNGNPNSIVSARWIGAQSEGRRCRAGAETKGVRQFFCVIGFTDAPALAAYSGSLFGRRPLRSRSLEMPVSPMPVPQPVIALPGDPPISAAGTSLVVRE
jgi:hypothetical protein